MLCAISLQFYCEIYKQFLSEYWLYSRLFHHCSLWKFLITTGVTFGCSSKAAGQTSFPATAVGQRFCKPVQSLMTTWIFRDLITWVASEGRFSSDIKQTLSTSQITLNKKSKRTWNDQQLNQYWTKAAVHQNHHRVSATTSD